MEPLMAFIANGKDEGIAKAISQVVVYSLDKRKVLMQLNAHTGRSRLPWKTQARNWTTGVTSSALLSGMVFLSYFSIYNTLISTHAYSIASPLASFLTSFIKVPVGNGMRMLQCGAARNFIHATRIAKLPGLYSGYSTALVEDIIEMDVRNRLYTCFRGRCRNHDSYRDVSVNLSNIGVGMGSCAVAAGITTPFDVIRAHMAHPKTLIRLGPVQTASALVRDHGYLVLYRGVALRITSNAIKSMVFFIVYEILKHTKQ